MAARYKPTVVEKHSPVPRPPIDPADLDRHSSTSSDSATQLEAIELDSEVFRPTARPPMGVLHVYDDGSRTSGECVRVRANRTVIGRTEGDIVIPHDAAISSRHAEIVRQVEGSKYCWSLRDLGSTNGTFVRVAKCTLKSDQEFIVGSRRYAYRDAPQPTLEAAAEPPPSGIQATQGWQTLAPDKLPDLCPTVVELLPSGEERITVNLVGDLVKLGSSESVCTHQIQGDPYVSSIHATISRGEHGRWKLTDEGSVNGVWVRISNLSLDSVCEFQIGEQRFRFRPLM